MSYTKYELSNFRGSWVQGPSKPDLSGCALPYKTIKDLHGWAFDLPNIKESPQRETKGRFTSVWAPESATISLSDKPIR